MTQSWNVLGQLLPFGWRELKDLPCVSIKLACGNRLTEHEQYAVPAADVENGDRKSARHTFVIPFRRCITGYVDLYPTTFRRFLQAILDPSCGTLVHPEFGEIDAYVADWSIDWVAEKRDGADVSVTFVESNENGVGLETAAPSMVDAQQAALSLEVTMKSADPPIVDPDPSGLTLSEELAKLAGLKMLAELQIGAVLGEIGSVVNRVNNLLDTIGSLSDPKSSSMYGDCLTIMNAMQGMSERLSPSDSSKRIVSQINDKDRSASDAAAFFSMSSADFYMLNPAVASLGSVSAGDVVLVYKGR